MRWIWAIRFILARRHGPLNCDTHNLSKYGGCFLLNAFWRFNGTRLLPIATIHDRPMAHAALIRAADEFHTYRLAAPGAAVIHHAAAVGSGQMSETAVANQCRIAALTSTGFSCAIQWPEVTVRSVSLLHKARIGSARAESTHSQV